MIKPERFDKHAVDPGHTLAPGHALDLPDVTRMVDLGAAARATTFPDVAHGVPNF